MSQNEVARITIWRGAEIFGLGFLFRLQEFVIALGWAPWSDLFRVDILNAIGMSMMLMGLACWAVVAAVDGQELNKVYRRTADGLVVDHEVMVEPGTGIALMPTDIHSIHTIGQAPTRHLHMYGLALEKLDKRMAYDPETGEAIPYNANFMKPTVPLGA